MTPGGRARAGAGGPRTLGGEQVEGRRAVRELLAGTRRVHEVWMASGLAPSPVLSEISDLAGRRRVPLRAVTGEAVGGRARTEAHQGVVARAEPLTDWGLDALCRPVSGVAPFLVVLEGVTDPHNLGSVLRSAEGAGVTGVLVPRHRAARITPTVTKAAAGALEHLRLATVAGVPGALEALSRHQVWTVGLDPGSTVSLFETDLAGEAVALVLGAEDRGLSRLSLRRCDVVAAIPQRGRLASLNVSAAAAVACFELARRRATIVDTA